MLRSVTHLEPVGRTPHSMRPSVCQPGEAADLPFWRKMVTMQNKQKPPYFPPGPSEVIAIQPRAANLDQWVRKAKPLQYAYNPA
ncbi:Hypothetical predicted protein [Pelobates cultripes]|uniref:Uncharacterized protein n=1 Tax=Pelobates cultripes TaxID=61616 RepID=A0AAD1QZR7_PELCU|nr:Hypothetical predicted protein [Pelobates cultripes]